MAGTTSPIRALLPSIVLVAAACAPEPPPPWQEADGYRWRELRVDDGDEPGFTRMTSGRTGIAFSNDITREQEATNRMYGHGSGVALGDVDGDGLVDIYLASLNGPNGLYLNRGGWRFEEVGAERGAALPDRASTGAVLADVDGDGDLDLLVTALGGSNALLANDGTGRFTDVTEEAGLVSDRGSATATLADVDGDGDLDLYVANYKVKAADDLFSPEERSLARITAGAGESGMVRGPFREHFRVEMRGGSLERVELAEADYFYLNDGSGRFEAVDFTGGRFLDADGRPLRETPREWAFTARFHDMDHDGDADLYVCNDLESPEHIWRNDGTGTFRMVDPLSIRTTSSSSMAVAFGDVDRNGLDDVFVTDMLPFHDTPRAKIRAPIRAPEPPPPGQIAHRSQRERNTLLVQEDGGRYVELANFAGLEASDWSWGVVFVDVDLDGWRDVLVATGHAWDVQDSDVNARLLETTTLVDWEEMILRYPRLEAPNVAFRNRGDLTFERTGGEWGFTAEPDISHGIATGDLDGDGDEDVVVTRLNAPPLVYRNEAPAPRVAVRLVGAPPNTAGVGAQIRLVGAPGGVQQREVAAGGLYLSHSDGQVTFAAGDAAELALEVRWPSGRRTRIDGVRPNRLYEIREEGAGAASAVRNGGPTDRARGGAPGADTASGPAPLFRDVTDRLGHHHVDAPFEDFVRQLLLPGKLSRLGPGLAWYDVDGDGDPDLLAGTGAGGRVAYLRNDGDGFTPVPVGADASAYDRPTVLPVPGAGGGVDLLVGQMNYEAMTPREAASVPAVLRLSGVGRGGGRLAPAVPALPASTGPLALSDYDGDGDLDLFVGGRTYPGAYPRPTDARLYLNDGDAFRLDEANSRLLEQAGLVSGATFTDVDGDGDPDLVLALDWGPLRLLENDAGRFSEATAAWGLSEHTGRWNGIAAGDLDGDGRMDLVATGWGRNVDHRPLDGHPLALYWGDFDASGTLDLLLARHDPRLGERAPLMPLGLLSEAVPYIRNARTPTFREYAEADVAEVLGPAMDRARVLEARTLAHTAFLNRGGRFEATPLPAAAQHAPAFHASVADVDGDGREDVVLSQNFYPTDITSHRYDQGRGLVLRGDGAGGLEPLPPRESGILVFGDQRGAALADFDRDGRVDLAVSQNGAATRLYRNEGARPGLRVRLVGPPSNPYAVGATVRVLYADGAGPAREIRAGSGYWSMDEPVPVLGLRGAPTGLRVRWPDGRTTEVPLDAEQREVTVRNGER